MNKDQITPTDLFWKPSRCCFCQEQFTSEDFPAKNYRLFKAILSLGMLVMLFHKKCWTKYKQENKKAWEQISNDPIFRWSRGEWKN